MKICRTVPDMQQACRSIARSGKTLGLVPTMGALHEGHLSLVARAQSENDAVAVTIFVNPTQFGPNEDFSKYPRTFEEDCRKLEDAGIDLLFAPEAAEMYPAGATTFVEVGEIGDRLDGASRPGHFRGVATVVSKLFHITSPDRAYFGQKDAAQVAVLRAMTRDLNFPLALVVCPTFREADGLAMSSRNRYLNAEERARATTLYKALQAAQQSANSGEHCAGCLRETMLAVLATEPSLRIDYAAIVNPDTLEPLTSVKDGALLAVAAWNGTTRLIDNILLPAIAETTHA
jgi:pantoate--beta-alanine ligase